MRLIMGVTSAVADESVLRNMFEARKLVFVDLLGWKLPLLHGRYEVDQFDTDAARYLVLSDETGAHRASARLLPTTGPHLLGDVFAELCEVPVPRCAATFEITRFCLDRRQSARERREVRDELISAIVDFALAERISVFTAVADLGWFEQILTFGWTCHALGLPRVVDAATLVALRIEIDAHTPAAMAQAGIYRPRPARSPTAIAA